MFSDQHTFFHLNFDFKMKYAINGAIPSYNIENTYSCWNAVKHSFWYFFSFYAGMESSEQWPFLSELQWFRRRRKRAVNVSLALSHRWGRFTRLLPVITQYLSVPKTVQIWETFSYKQNNKPKTLVIWVLQAYCFLFSFPY